MVVLHTSAMASGGIRAIIGGHYMGAARAAARTAARSPVFWATLCPLRTGTMAARSL